MADMGLPLAYGAGFAPDQLAQIIKDRLLIQEQQRRQAELEWQKQYQGGMLGIAQSQEGRDAQLFGPQLETATSNARVATATEPERIRIPGLTNDATVETIRRQRFLTARDENIEGERQGAMGRLRANPALAPVVDLTSAGVPTSNVDAFDPTGETGFERDKELADIRGRWAMSAAGASRRSDQERPYAMFRTIQTQGPNGEPAGTKVIGIKWDGTVDDLGFDEAAVPAAMRGQAAQMGGVLEQAKGVRGMYRPDLVGPWEGRKTKVQAEIGYLNDTDKARLQAAVQSMQNMLLYARTGKQINEPEMKRMMRELPDISQTPTMFETRLDQSEANLRLIEQRLLSGYKAPDESTSPTVAPSAQPSGRFTITKVSP